MRVVFMGFQTWGYETLKALLASRHEVPLVCTHPESQQIYEVLWNDSVKELAYAHGIPVLEQQYLHERRAIEMIREVEPDILVLSDWRTWVSPALYSLARFGGINIHDALLPKYGGFAPINWAVANGEKQTGVTVHFLNEEFDLGDIIMQEAVSIGPTETATDIFYKIIPLVASLPLQALDAIEDGTVQPVPQEKSQASFFHKRSERDSFIDWNMDVSRIFNLIRAQSDPYPNAFTFYKGKKLNIKKASLPQKSFCGTPGRIFHRLAHGVVVLGNASCVHENQGIVIESVQEEGGEVMSANDYFQHMGEYLG
ncbi:MAG TPA: methionyl-tRNA formyltransferase [Ktedonobacteraceae bacterium]|jgi:methionyl-tRNA formyltransferase|nr:methionyl-tRNA formyltransferase [Ktedonobacteraceae bacterium]